MIFWGVRTFVEVEVRIVESRLFNHYFVVLTEIPFETRPGGHKKNTALVIMNLILFMLITFRSDSVSDLLFKHKYYFSSTRISVDTRQINVT